MLEVNSTTQIVHGYPCSEEEAKNNVITLKRKVKNEIEFGWDVEERDPELEIDIKLFIDMTADSSRGA